MSSLSHSLVALFAICAVACAAPGPDGGDDGFTDPGGDDGGGDDGGGNCEPDIVPAPAGQACAAATRTCMDACQDDACYDACLTADPDAENCGTCLEDGYIACVNAAGCQPEWDAVICCFDGCADPESAACETECTPENTAYEGCIETYDEGCFEMTNTTCFQAA
jgi:hypothetical protein